MGVASLGSFEPSLPSVTTEVRARSSASPISASSAAYAVPVNEPTTTVTPIILAVPDVRKDRRSLCLVLIFLCNEEEEDTSSLLSSSIIFTNNDEENVLVVVEGWLWNADDNEMNDSNNPKE
eukprot:CAMPEP_0170947200 /NCGR_PEP_ID=MMETSP0735-20130129/27702_1 /TAXON_ID=186038 /ORGANISM="Fragilariopsis kerguelensis, Strain L26-C5" /LENGTH=121 /DNA_ID=CAMNT_0011356355 /DNA_START=915 /DNA_END=1280 /DNA_ORIENTATION=-